MANIFGRIIEKVLYRNFNKKVETLTNRYGNLTDIENQDVSNIINLAISNFSLNSTNFLGDLFVALPNDAIEYINEILNKKIVTDPKVYLYLDHTCAIALKPNGVLVLADKCIPIENDKTNPTDCDYSRVEIDTKALSKLDKEQKALFFSHTSKRSGEISDSRKVYLYTKVKTLADGTKGIKAFADESDVAYDNIKIGHNY